MKRQNAVSAHLRNNLRGITRRRRPLRHSRVPEVRKALCGLTNPQREKQIRTIGYAIEDHAGFGSLQIPVGLAPPILVDNLGQRDTADWPKLAHGVTDRRPRQPPEMSQLEKAGSSRSTGRWRRLSRKR
jgi:hypothetical protein